MNEESLRQQAIALDTLKHMVNRDYRKLGMRESEARHMANMLDGAAETILAVRTGELTPAVAELDF